ncbi:hypothetical protein PoB_005051200 [Plakobranchus ocellatus]|uniref:Uncharacterized protein n=1 Tax=Plakobranchus ocellatus TaxID=259542 RepID=A0AAV4BXZ5_9GAST|nr:hypothetical protein PoB_005051200 [Plakobranchus ocellatus]
MRLHLYPKVARQKPESIPRNYLRSPANRRCIGGHPEDIRIPRLNVKLVQPADEMLLVLRAVGSDNLSTPVPIPGYPGLILLSEYSI